MHCYSSFHLFLCLLLLIINTYTATASSQSIISTLPGFHGILPFKLETGYIGVGEEDEVQLFYYFIQSENDQKEILSYYGSPADLVVLVSPALSMKSVPILLLSIFFHHLGMGVLEEATVGPLAFDLEGFDGSFPSLIINPYSWTKVANIIFIDSPVGTGFSYATTPQAYHSNNTISAQYNYSFLRKGYIVGNAVMDPNIDINEKVPYAHRMGLISDEYFELAKRSCNGEYLNPDPNNTECLYALRLVKEGTITDWKRCNFSLPYEEDVESVFKHHQLLSEKGFQALVYSGDHDMTVSYTSTLKWIRNMNLTVEEEWRPWFVNGQVAGYTLKYSKNLAYLTFATVKARNSLITSRSM
ncbi:UNVERIFIED_CONTAM: Serine carboxypeptidase-like 18 [Sesamum calycinum]|uniref:Serine carboxypeptidase-like 18 n=1 Tax=Sesamum calycinum TaxID=2727403 RepID=A0AAW2N433_9LAMI